jgi:hypothetical protein
VMTPPASIASAEEAQPFRTTPSPISTNLDQTRPMSANER